MRFRLIPVIQRVTHRIGVSLYRDSSLGVTQGEAHVLVHLLAEGEATIADVHRAFAHRRSTLTSILDRLVERGLIRRATGERDRRTFVLSLTAAGRAAARRAAAHFERIEAAALRATSQADLKGFETVMRAIEAELERERGDVRA